MQVLTISDAIAIGQIADMASRCAKVARLMDDGNVIYGTARSIGDERGMFLSSSDDVREGFLRVTTQGGFEAFWPIADLVPLVQSTEFTEYDW